MGSGLETFLSPNIAGTWCQTQKKSHQVLMMEIHHNIQQKGSRWVNQEKPWIRISQWLIGAAAIYFFKLNHPMVHISIWLKIRVNEKGVNNQTGSLTDQYCQQAAVNLSQRCAQGSASHKQKAGTQITKAVPAAADWVCLILHSAWQYFPTSLPNGFLSGSCSDVENILCRRARLKLQWIANVVDYEWPLLGLTTLI